MDAMTRLPGWEARFVAVIEAARHSPYRLGEHDCLRLSCANVEALIGVDYWPRFKGYKTRRQALVTIAKIAPSLGEAVTATLAVQPAPTFTARRGDLVLYRDVEDHLGVCVGSTVVVLADDGLRFIGMGNPGLLACWRIG